MAPGVGMPPPGGLQHASPNAAHRKLKAGGGMRAQSPLRNSNILTSAAA